MRGNMRAGYRLRIVCFAFAILTGLTAMAAQDGVIIKRTPKVGDISKFRMKAQTEAPDASKVSHKIVFTSLITEKVTKVADNGDYTVESTTGEVKISYDGTDVPSAGSAAQEISTVTFKPSGEVVAIATDRTDPNIFRMATLEALQFPSTPVKKDSTWDADFKKNDQGAVDAKGNFKIEAEEKMGGVDCYRIHATIKESTGTQPAASDTIYWISIKDGTLMRQLATFTSAPFAAAPVPLDAKVEVTRES